MRLLLMEPELQWSLDGPINGESFAGFCEWLSGSQPCYPGDLVVMDNLSSHKSVSVAIQAIESCRRSSRLPCHRTRPI